MIPLVLLLFYFLFCVVFVFVFLFFMDACSDGKESACNTGDLGSIPGLGRSPGGGHGNALQCSCLENSKDEEPGWAIVHVAMKS